MDDFGKQFPTNTAFSCRIKIIDDSLDENRFKRAYVKGYRTLVPEFIKDQEPGLFFSINSLISSKITTTSFFQTHYLKLLQGPRVLPKKFNNSFLEGIFIPQRGMPFLNNLSLNEEFSAYENIDIVWASQKILHNDLREKLFEIPKNSPAFITEKIEGVDVDIEFYKSFFGKLKWKIESDFPQRKVHELLEGTVFKDSKVVAPVQSGDKLFLKILGNDFDGHPFKSIGLTRNSSLYTKFGKKLNYDYNLKQAKIFLTSFRRHNIYLPYRLLCNFSEKLSLSPPPLIREMIVHDHYEFLNYCAGAASTPSLIDEETPKRGLNVFIESTSKFDRISYFSYNYIELLYRSLFWTRKNLSF